MVAESDDGVLLSGRTCVSAWSPPICQAYERTLLHSRQVRPKTSTNLLGNSIFRRISDVSTRSVRLRDDATDRGNAVLPPRESGDLDDVAGSGRLDQQAAA